MIVRYKGIEYDLQNIALGNTTIKGVIDTLYQTKNVCAEKKIITFWIKEVILHSVMILAMIIMLHTKKTLMWRLTIFK